MSETNGSVGAGCDHTSFECINFEQSAILTVCVICKASIPTEDSSEVAARGESSKILRGSPGGPKNIGLRG